MARWQQGLRRGAVCRASKAKGVPSRTRPNRALMGGCCARDPRLYGCGMATQLSRYAEVCGRFRCRGHHPSRNMAEDGFWAFCGPWLGPGFLRRLVRATTRRRVPKGAARSLNVSGREGTGDEARRNSGGRSERASHHGITREASPFEHRPSGARPRYRTACDPRLLFPAKSLPIRAIHWNDALRHRASPRVKRPRRIPPAFVPLRRAG
jgi:hypothetical protein